MADLRMLPINSGVRQGQRVSVYSLGWTLTTGSAAIAVGVLGNSLALVVFGAIGLLDAVGSATLIVHFRHAIRHQAVSERSERATLLIVSIGMAVVGVATIADSTYRLVNHVNASSLPAGIVITGASVVVLATLAFVKRRVARRIPSHALNADGWVSATGAVLAGVALIATVLNDTFRWWWMDPLAAIVVATGAVTMSVILAK